MPCSECIKEQLLVVPERPLERFPMGSTWRGRLTAASCISERILFLPLVSDTIGQVCAGPAGLQLQLCALRSLEGCLQPEKG